MHIFKKVFSFFFLLLINKWMRLLKLLKWKAWLLMNLAICSTIVLIPDMWHIVQHSKVCITHISPPVCLMNHSSLVSWQKQVVNVTIVSMCYRLPLCGLVRGYEVYCYKALILFNWSYYSSCFKHWSTLVIFSMCWPRVGVTKVASYLGFEPQMSSDSCEGLIWSEESI